jgi:hypothetical protein
MTALVKRENKKLLRILEPHKNKNKNLEERVEFDHEKFIRNLRENHL